MDEMEIEKRLYEAAAEGDIRTLHELLQQDGLILDRLTLTCFNETPLHIAAMRGHVEFVKLILTRNPLLAAELDFRKSSALHVASIKGYPEIVKLLLVVNPEMCLARDRDGRNPLHLAAIKGRVEVIKELIQTSHLAASQTTNRGESILHLCVKHNQLEALKLLMEVISDYQLLNARDGDGYTILHLAVSDKQIETVTYLLRNNQIEVNLQDDNGNTALDILAQSRRDMIDLQIGDTLREAGGLRAKDIPSPNTQNFAKFPNKKSSIHQSHDMAGDWLSKKRDAIMVVASLIATMAFQAGMNPPGGFWQGNEDVDSQGNTLQMPHKAGEAVMAYSHPKSYRYFIRVNSTAFVASLSTILLLISGLPFRKKLFMWSLMVIMWLTVTSTALTYGISIYIVTPKKDREHLGQVIEVAVTVWCFVMALLLLGNTIRLAYKWMRKRHQSEKFERRESSNLVHVNV
ncbi:ankyrin repeat-containing protein NPR4-like [Lycium ferocissimum]|uniref:ankyrin repeat-containing protein NPR4-like n=1 Tax=Lycium ferocissimum TaxID=112874 RepID=UPI00281621D2|nr:ankyrin repeat-containing protein NPR4-like [Lycium ferocissimum]